MSEEKITIIDDHEQHVSFPSAHSDIRSGCVCVPGHNNMISCASVCPCMKVWPFGNDWKWAIESALVCFQTKTEHEATHMFHFLLVLWLFFYFESSNLIGCKSWDQQCTITPLQVVATGLKHQWQTAVTITSISTNQIKPSSLPSMSSLQLEIMRHYWGLELNLTKV